MSDEPTVPPIIRQGQILETMTNAIVNEVEVPWSKLTFLARQTAPWGQMGTYITKLDGEIELDFPPRTIGVMIDELRTLMYRPGVGTWFTMWIEIDESGRSSSRFDYDDEPEWTRPADPLIYFEDLRKYPRDPEHIPEWLAEKVALGKADFDRHHNPDGSPGSAARIGDI